ncbi:Retrovirus-related Pol polyprotein from transposon RE1 [Vitis vinifera]|uniref:Retrovirus-related Pol polyprotein from transposon RE1 n=1 Tax=Vitis vinifera TaxID=29760 RepID=A0A438IMW8_VITVI|nr:Retrovirus-related Pol polyprotein from transposon RE1 [Vitis vinifera]
MVDEMAALHSNDTWDLVSLPLGYTQIYGCDYGDTFFPVTKIASICLFLSIVAMCHWPLYQLDIKNFFLLGELLNEVYMEQPPVVQEFGMIRSEADHSVFYHHNSSSQCIYLVVYMDDIVIIGNDQEGIQRLKQHLFNHFQTKDLGKLKYFLGLEIAQSSLGVVMSQRKYALDILEETGEPLRDLGRYRQLVGKLNYLTITRPDHLFYCECGAIPKLLVSQMQTGLVHPQIGVPPHGIVFFIGCNLISWKSKKQDVVARSSVEAEYRAMALATCEFIWLRQLLQKLRFGKDEQIKLVCDNQAALHIASNPVFHEMTKHIEVDYHFIREKIASGCVATSFVNSNDQLADIFTKSLRGPRIKYICNKLGAYDIYAPA